MSKDKKYLGGYITVEAAYIFPIFILIIVAVLRLGMQIHDKTTDTALSQYLSIKEKSIQQSCYNPAIRRIDMREVVNAGIVEVYDMSKELNKLYVQCEVTRYRNSMVLYSDDIPLMDITVRRGLKNSTIVRTVHVLKSHAERIMDND